MEREAVLRGQEREKYEMVAEGIKGYRSERELGMLSFLALGGNNREKKDQWKLKMQRNAHILLLQ